MTTTTNTVETFESVIADSIKRAPYGDLVAKELATREIDSRVRDLVKGIEKHRQLTKELEKIRFDVQTFDSEGAVVAEGFSKPKLDERKKLVEQIGKLETAVATAVTDSNYEPLRKQL